MWGGFQLRAGERYNVEGKTISLGVTGISWGAAMASGAAILSQLPVACIPCLGSDSPIVMSEGIINWQLDWGALMKEKQQTREEAALEIRRVFTSTTLGTLLEIGPEPKASIASLVQVAAKSDYFVSAEEGMQLYSKLHQAVAPSGLTDLIWVDGGHASSFVWQKDLFVPACVRAVDSLQVQKDEQS
eukprot:gnl/MRDRNA2_/MRDRNA2_143600_c0_seq1.p1 gnl/MRDRNA2_/MRDRNA2_143600_c0~~gnl/MRDRNA2_/MRDRNA2_143600_c0_seq1.p1  ORF type:complete len:187 (+),score=45.49 gnl/MRDRNA2_/MRDRNA2_143600_c0_seq1:3-563(+)